MRRNEFAFCKWGIDPYEVIFRSEELADDLIRDPGYFHFRRLYFNSKWEEVLIFWLNGCGVNTLFWDDDMTRDDGLLVAGNGCRCWNRRFGLEVRKYSQCHMIINGYPEVRKNSQCYMLIDYQLREACFLIFDDLPHYLGALRQVRFNVDIFTRPVPWVDFNCKHDKLFDEEQRLLKKQ